MPASARVYHPKTQTPPWFQFYWSEWLHGTRHMTHECKGIYMDLLCHAWDKGSLPRSLSKRAEIVNLTAADFLRHWKSHIGRKWVLTDRGYINDRQETVRLLAAAFSEKQAEKARKKWGSRDAAAVPRHAAALPRDAKTGHNNNKTEQHKTEQHTTNILAAPSALRECWNAYCGTLPKCQEFNPGRQKKAAARLKDRPIGQWAEVVDRIAQSNFCNGESASGWVATFDWLLQPDTAAKVLEGKYDNRKPRADADPNAEVWAEVKEAIHGNR